MKCKAIHLTGTNNLILTIFKNNDNTSKSVTDRFTILKSVKNINKDNAILEDEHITQIKYNSMDEINSHLAAKTMLYCQ